MRKLNLFKGKTPRNENTPPELYLGTVRVVPKRRYSWKGLARYSDSVWRGEDVDRQLIDTIEQLSGLPKWGSLENPPANALIVNVRLDYSMGWAGVLNISGLFGSLIGWRPWVSIQTDLQSAERLNQTVGAIQVVEKLSWKKFLIQVLPRSCFIGPSFDMKDTEALLITASETISEELKKFLDGGP